MTGNCAPSGLCQAVPPHAPDHACSRALCQDCLQSHFPMYMPKRLLATNPLGMDLLFEECFRISLHLACSCSNYGSLLQRDAQRHDWKMCPLCTVVCPTIRPSARVPSRATSLCAFPSNGKDYKFWQKNIGSSFPPSTCKGEC